MILSPYLAQYLPYIHLTISGMHRARADVQVSTPQTARHQIW